MKRFTLKRLVLYATAIAWVTLCVAALVKALNAYSGISDWQTEEGLAFEMMALAFPSSIVVYLTIVFVGIVLRAFGAGLSNPSRTGMVFWWALFVFAGSLQWFVVLPRLIKRKRNATITDLNI